MRELIKASHLILLGIRLIYFPMEVAN